MLRVAAFATLLLFGGGSALAQNMSAPPAAGMHPTMNGPCAADRARYCKGVQPGGGRFIDCLEAHKTQLAVACRARMEPMFTARDRAGSKTNAPGMNMQSQPPGAKPPG